MNEKERAQADDILQTLKGLGVSGAAVSLKTLFEAMNTKDPKTYPQVGAVSRITDKLLESGELGFGTVDIQ